MKKLSKKTLNKSFRNWYYGHLTCFSQEHMQTFGYLCAMLPIVEELYDTKEEQIEALQTYTAFFNTEPQLGSVIVGVSVGLEEAKANGENVDGETINGLRAGLMGPIAGIGDSLVVGVLIPLILGIALGLSTDGSPVGAIFYIIVWNLLVTFGMRMLYLKGYEFGGKAVEFLTGEKSKALRESVMMLGSMVIGAVAATWVSVNTVFQMTNPDTKEPYLVLNDQINAVLPKGLTAIFILFCWYLIAKKKVSPLKVMLLLVVIAFVGVFFGF
ncbi:MAG: PTS system mannose/fructose/sorbose family transporter subunit IID, partial [Longicatena sp.]